jgi:hypothetical protein
LWGRAKNTHAGRARFGVIWAVESHRKFFSFRADPNHLHIRPRLVPQEGRIAIVTDAGRDAVDAGSASDEGADRGRRSRVVLTPRRWRQVGGKYFLPMTVAIEPDRRRARRKPLKPLRAPGCSGELAVNTRVYFPLLCAHEAAGAPGTRHSHALWAEVLGIARAHRAARARGMFEVVRSVCRPGERRPYRVIYRVGHRDRHLLYQLRPRRGSPAFRRDDVGW